jgi:hypothetical protein
LQQGTFEVWLPWRRRCAEVSESEEAELLRNVAILAAEKPLRGNPGGRETVSWWLHGGADGLLAAEDLSPRALDALRDIACLAFGKLPTATWTAVGGATHALAARLGFPESCRPATAPTS